MDKIRRFEDVTAKISNSISYHEALLIAWQDVKRVSKKNGENFAILSKNFEGCEIKTPYYSSSFSDKKVFVYTRNGSEYIDDYFDAVKLEVVDGRKMYVELTADEIADHIADRIRTHSDYIAGLKRQLETANTYFTAVKEHTEALKNILKDERGENGVNSSLYFALVDYIENFRWTY